MAPKLSRVRPRAQREGRTLPDCTVYEHENWNTNDGDEGGWSYRTSLRVSYIGDDWNDQISSIIVHSGTWRFYEDVNFGGDYIEFREGYHNLPARWNDRITSYEPISW